MPQLARSESASAGSGFSWKPWIRPSAPVIATPYWLVSATRLVARVATPSWDSWNSRIAARSMSVSASPAMTRKESPRKLGDVADPARGPEQLLLVAVGELDAELRAVAEVALDRLREPVQVGDRLAEAVAGEQAHDVLHHRPVQHRHHRLRHRVGDRPQPRAEPRRQDHRPHRLAASAVLEALDRRRPAAGRRRARSASSSETRSPSIVAQSRRSIRVSPSVSIRTTAAPAARDQLGGQLEAAALARVLVAVFEEDGREPAVGRRPSRRSRCGRPRAARRRRRAAWRSR